MVNNEDCGCSKNKKIREGGNVSNSGGDEVDPWSDPNNLRKVEFPEIEKAGKILAGTLNRTMTIKSKIGPMVGIDELWITLAYQQTTGSFKERGARYVLMKLPEEQKKKGAVSASMGNHAQAMCYHGFLLKIPITVFMPESCPESRTENCRKWGANVVIGGKDMEEAKNAALRYAKEKGMLFVNGYDHPDVIAGAGSLAFEIMQDVKDADMIMIPVGGGGLLSGLAVAMKTLSPKTKIYAVETSRAPGWSSATKAGKPLYTPVSSTIAPGLAVNTVGVNAFHTAKYLIDDCIVVDEKWLAAAMLLFLENDRIVVEGAGCVGLAAILANQCKGFCGKKVICVLSGGNVDTPVLLRCIERGLVMLGRLVNVTVEMLDKPTGIAELVKIITDCGATIKHVGHERAWLMDDMFSVSIRCVCETFGVEHVNYLKGKLQGVYGEQVTVEPQEVEKMCNPKRCGKK